MKKNIYGTILMATCILLTFTVVVCCQTSKKSNLSVSQNYSEQYRPQFHFSQPMAWMNDPNGMVFLDGEYHLFYQYYPDSTVWGPMHWGHAISKDLIHWEHLPIALYPDSIGCIFSGSAVADINNTSGFGKNGEVPLVAIFTYHNFEKEKAGRNDFQTQGIAYSNDKGRTWIKYTGNPVIKNPGIRDFRDPKVMWHEPSKKWIMTLATLNCISFFSSPDLKNWKKESEFGHNIGRHGAPWECPDLFPMKVKNTDQEKWVLIVSINPCGPNGGSATQYFVGDFNGSEFKSSDTLTRWIDYGKDNYAGVTWSNIPKEDGRTLFLGWMSNWQYANKVPTKTWRGATTLPRELTLLKENEGYCLASGPARELLTLRDSMASVKPTNVSGNQDISNQIPFDKTQVELIIKFGLPNSQRASKFGIKLSNSQNEQVLIGYDAIKSQFYVDRRNSGNDDFSDNFKGIFVTGSVDATDTVEMHLLVDKASVELFGQQGRAVMSNIFFPSTPYNQLSIFSENGLVDVQECKVWKLKSIW